MKRNHILILGTGIIICAVLFFIDIYLGAIGVVFLGALAMSVFIMQETHDLPDITLRLREDATGVVIQNQGNAAAYKIRVAIVPLNIEFKLEILAPDTLFEFPVESMINEAKGVVEFENAEGAHYTHSYSLSALGKTEDDLLKPLFPMFKWK